MTIVIFRKADNLVNVGRQLSAWTRQRAESWWKIKAFEFVCIIAAIAVVAIIAFTATRQALFEETLSALPPNPVVEVERGERIRVASGDRQPLSPRLSVSRQRPAPVYGASSLSRAKISLASRSASL